MGLDRGGQCVRVAVMLCTGVTLLGGILVLAIGVMTCVDSSYLKALIGTNLFLSSAYIMLTCGVLLTLTIGVGCAGAIKERKCFLLIHFVILFLVLVLLIIGCILTYVFRVMVEEKMKNTMLTTIQLDYGNVPAVTETWDELQIKYQCCGVDTEDELTGIKTPGYAVWTRNRKFRNPSGPHVPRSCCIRTEDQSVIDESDCQGPNPSSHSTNYEGCLNRTLEEVVTRAYVQSGICIGISSLVILGMILAGVLFKIIDSST